MNILLIEDNRELNKMICDFLEDEGWKVSSHLSGYDGLEAYYEIKPDLVIVDWMLPDISGIEICKEIKNSSLKMPILMLTAKSSDRDEIEGFKNGVDEYIRKPFNPEILILRIYTLLGRKKIKTIEIDEKILINLEKKQLLVEKKEISLSPKEYELFLYLAENRGRYFSREQLLEYIWGFDYQGESRTVDSHINYLRKKISKDLIKTKRGVGYKMLGENEY